MTLNTINSSLCPLCGEDNSCKVAAVSEDSADCWCMVTEIPQALLQQLPEEQRLTACICSRCVERFKTEQKPSK